MICGILCEVCGGGLGGSLQSGRLRTGSSCTACICGEGEDVLDPCDIAASMLNIAGITTAFNSVHGMIDNPYEWGVSVNAHFSGSDIVFDSSELYTSEQETSLEMQYSWGSTEGYTISMVHSHPNGGTYDCFSVDDIYTLQSMLNTYKHYKSEIERGQALGVSTNVQESYVRLLEEYASIVVVGLNATYAVTVKDWDELDRLLNGYTVSYAQSQVSIYNDDRGYTYEAALLKYFGSAINMHKSARDNLNFNQYYQLNSNQTTLIGCPPQP